MTLSTMLSKPVEESHIFIIIKFHNFKIIKIIRNSLHEYKEQKVLTVVMLSPVITSHKRQRLPKRDFNTYFYQLSS